MKNQKKENDKQSHLPANVVAAIDAVTFLEGLVNYLADRRKGSSNFLPIACPGQETIHTCTMETFISGNLGLADKNKYLRIPFGSCFIFTCIREHEGTYNVAWSNSLS